MTRKEFRDICERKIVYLDGATGSYLQEHGMPSGVCPETYILEHEDLFVDMQKKYLEAGTDILYAPTFTANRIKLEEYGIGDEIEEYNTRLIQLRSEERRVGKEC